MQVRPLRLDGDDRHRAVCGVLKDIENGPYRDREGMTHHVLVRYLRENTFGLWTNRQSVNKWRQAKPGTLFFWDNKYCVKPHEPEATAELCRELKRLGRQVASRQCGPALVEVYERLPDGSSAKEVAKEPSN